MLKKGVEPSEVLTTFLKFTRALPDRKPVHKLRGREHITEEEMIRNAEFAARALKPYGLEYIQVDEGGRK